MTIEKNLENAALADRKIGDPTVKMSSVTDRTVKADMAAEKATSELAEEQDRIKNMKNSVRIETIRADQLQKVADDAKEKLSQAMKDSQKAVAALRDNVSRKSVLRLHFDLLGDELDSLMRQNSRDYDAGSIAQRAINAKGQVEVLVGNLYKCSRDLHKYVHTTEHKQIDDMTSRLQAAFNQELKALRHGAMDAVHGAMDGMEEPFCNVGASLARKLDDIADICGGSRSGSATPGSSPTHAA